MKIDTGLGERIRQLRQSRGLTQKEFADSLGIAQGFLSSIERGRKIPSTTLLIAMTHRYQVEEQWLSSGGRGAGPGLGPEHPVAKTPLLQRISPGFPEQLAPEDVLGYVALPDSPPDCYALMAYGDFMAPTIQNNDLVLFRLGEELKHGDIALVSSKWGDVILRRYRVNEDGEWFAPDNSIYKPFPAARSRIVGTVLDVWRKVKL